MQDCFLPIKTIQGLFYVFVVKQKGSKKTPMSFTRFLYEIFDKNNWTYKDTNERYDF